MKAEGSSCSWPGVLSPPSSSFLLPTIFSRLSRLFYVILPHINDLLIAISCTRERYGGDTSSGCVEMRLKRWLQPTPPHTSPWLLGTFIPALAAVSLRAPWCWWQCHNSVAQLSIIHCRLSKSCSEEERSSAGSSSLSWPACSMATLSIT